MGRALGGQDPVERMKHARVRLTRPGAAPRHGPVGVRVKSRPPDVLVDAWQYVYARRRDIYLEIRWRGDLIGLINVEVAR